MGIILKRLGFQHGHGSVGRYQIFAGASLNRFGGDGGPFFNQGVGLAPAAAHRFHAAKYRGWWRSTCSHAIDDIVFTDFLRAIWCICKHIQYDRGTAKVSDLIFLH